MFTLFTKEEKHIIPISYYLESIHHNLNKYIRYLSDLNVPQVLIDYLYNSSAYHKVTDALRDVKEQNTSLSKDIFISFIGTPKNFDCVDNHAHSRYLRKKEEGKTYVLQKRQWYVDALKSQDDVQYTSPYLAESGAYVLSIVRRVYKENKFIGVLGIDVLFDSLARVKNGDNVIIFNRKGKILYNSHIQLRYIIEKQNNILFFIPYNMFKEIIEGNQGESLCDFCSKKQNIEYASILNGQTYLLKTEHIHLINT